MIMVFKELEHFLFFQALKILATLKDDSHLFCVCEEVCEEQGVELTFDVHWRDFEKFQSKPHFFQEISSLQRFAMGPR